MEEARKDFVRIENLIEELNKDIPPEQVAVIKKAPSTQEKRTIVEVLTRAANEPKFLARLAENPIKVLQDYDLTPEEMAALASGDLGRIESWIGKLDHQLGTWIWCRLQLEKW